MNMENLDLIRKLLSGGGSGGGEETGQGHDGKASLNFFKMTRSIFEALFNHEIFEIQTIVIPKYAYHI